MQRDGIFIALESKQERDEKSYKILDANILRQMPTFLQKLTGQVDLAL